MKRALLFGVSKYNRSDWRDLWGVEEDILRWQKILKDTFRVLPEDTRVLFDARCSTAAILDRIKWLFDGTSSTDSVYLIYSGHGAQFASRDVNGLPSKRNECLVPFDFSWDNPLTDEMIAEYISSKNSSRCQLFCIFDCCHSGGIIRDIELEAKYPFVPEYPREIPIPSDILYRVETARGMGAPFTSLSTTLEDQAVILCACSADQKAYESWVNGDFRGVFSFALEQVLKSGVSNCGNLIEKCRELIIDRGFKAAKLQTPFCTNNDAKLF